METCSEKNRQEAVESHGTFVFLLQKLYRISMSHIHPFKGIVIENKEIANDNEKQQTPKEVNDLQAGLIAKGLFHCAVLLLGKNDIGELFYPMFLRYLEEVSSVNPIPKVIIDAALGKRLNASPIKKYCESNCTLNSSLVSQCDVSS